MGRRPCTNMIDLKPDEKIWRHHIQFRIEMSEVSPNPPTDFCIAAALYRGMIL
jgi:hypothetical protein